MRTTFLVCLLVAVASAGNAWKLGNEYQYQLRARSLTALHQVANQYSGVVIKAKVNVQPKSTSVLVVKVIQPQYAEIHTRLPGGWSAPISDRLLNYKQLPISGTTFLLTLQDGVVENMKINKDTPTWEVNMLKGVASQLQVNTLGRNLIHGKLNQKPNPNSSTATFKTMEKSVVGECETSYNISPLPKYLLQSKPELAPLASKYADDNPLLDVVKTKNFDNCIHHIGYNWGVSGLTGRYQPIGNNIGSAISRSSVSRIIIQGNRQRYTIQSAVTTYKVAMSPTLYGDQKGIVVNRVNITLVSVKSAPGSPQGLSSGRSTNLVYKYNNPFGEKRVRVGQGNNTYWSGSSSSSSSNNSGDLDFQGNGSSSSSEESQNQNRGETKYQPPYSLRYRQTINQNSRQIDSYYRHYPWYSPPMGHNNSYSSNSSSSSSSEEEYYQPIPTLSQPPSIPLLSYFVGYMGQSIQSAKHINPISAIHKLIVQIAVELQDPSNIPKHNSLAKFSILVRLIRTTSHKQLEELTRQTYVASKGSKSSSNTAAITIWKVLRDAVAQAGTGPTFSILCDWIKDGKVKQYEAADLISVQPNVARIPTPEYVDAFFVLATNPQVRKQRFLNTSAILAFANLVRKTQVDNATSYNYYPVHVFGRLSPKNNDALQKKYIPYISRELKMAVAEEDSKKIQVYIRALGNVAHPGIVSVFEPYLNGKQQVSKFQRLLMVVSMSQLTEIYPKFARQVLFKIYQNVGEAHEVRCAAIFQIMKTNPPAYMLQRMAYFTNYDQSNQVNSAVKSSILSAATLQDPDNAQLAENAQAVVNLLSPNSYSLHYSKSNLRSYISEQITLEYKHTLNYIGSKDSILPNSLFYNLRRSLGGIKRQNVIIDAMASSMNPLIEYLDNIMAGDDYEEFSGNTRKSRNDGSSNSQRPPNADSFSPNKIAELLGIQTDEADKLEANILIEFFGARRFVAFDENTIAQVPQLLQNVGASLRSGESFNLTKFYDPEGITLAFPGPLGFIIEITVNYPTLFQIGGEARLRVNPYLDRRSSEKVYSPRNINATADLHILYSSKTESQMSIILPFNHKKYIAGVEKTTQIYIPLRINGVADLQTNMYQLTLEPINKNVEHKIVHYSVLPYTSQENVLELRPVIELKNTNYIHIRETQEFQNIYGQQSTGMAFQINYPHQENFFDFQTVQEHIQKHDVFTIIYFDSAENTINHNLIELKYYPQNSSSSSVTLTVSYDDNDDDHDNNDNKGAYNDSSNYEDYSAKHIKSKCPSQYKCNRNNDSNNDSDADYNIASSSNAAQPSSTSPNSRSRQQQFIHRAGADIKHVYSSVLDASIQFNGPSKAYYAATAAYAYSPIDSKNRLLVFFSNIPAHISSNSKPFQMCLAVNGKYAAVPNNNYKQALKADPSSTINAELSFGEKCSSGTHISAKCNLEQRIKRRDYLQRHPLARLCESQMAEGNYWLPACRNVTYRANFFDQYQCSVRFQEVSRYVQNYTYKAYSVLRQLGYNYLDENVVSQTGENNKVYLSATYGLSHKSVNISIQAMNMASKFINVRVNPMVRPIVVAHPAYSILHRLARKALTMQYAPTCVADATYANTFDNKTYTIKFGKCWHVMMTTAPPCNAVYSSVSNCIVKGNATILIRDTGKDQRELKIILKDNDVVDLAPYSSSRSRQSHDVDDGKEGKGIAACNLQVNGRSVRISKFSLTEVDGTDGVNLLQATVLPDGAVYVSLPDFNLELIYDGLRAKVVASNSYRGHVRGLCGTFTGEPVTDFTSPKNCILKEPDEFTASYALVDHSCHGSAKDLQHRAAKASCYEQRAVLGDVINEHDASRTEYTYSDLEHDPSSSYSSSSNSDESDDNQTKPRRPGSSSNQSDCMGHRVKVIKVNTQYCFSKQRLPQCNPHCRAGEKVDKQINFHCIDDSKIVQHWAKGVETNNNPDFSRKPSSKSLRQSVPLSCHKNMDDSPEEDTSSSSNSRASSSTSSEEFVFIPINVQELSSVVISNLFPGHNPCTRYRPMMIDKDNLRCISQQPMLECNVHCRASEMVLREINFDCISPESFNNRANFDLSKKRSSMLIDVMVPLGCQK